MVWSVIKLTGWSLEYIELLDIETIGKFLEMEKALNKIQDGLKMRQKKGG